MRTLVLYFPRLGAQLARKANPELIGRPFGLLAGEGDGALLSAVSCEATSDGVEPGMTVPQARQRCPGIALEADNARQCLEALDEVVSIVRARATTSVAIVSRNAVAVSLEGLDSRFADEGAAALGLMALAKSWSGLDVRAAVASTIEEATGAAGKARRYPVICPGEMGIAARLPCYEPVSVAFSWGRRATALEAQAKLAKLAASLQLVLPAYGQSYRAVRVEPRHGAVRRGFLFRAAQPIQRAAQALEIIRQRLGADELEGVTSVRLTLEMAGPDVTVEPWRAHVASVHQLSAPAIPVQRRLLRAS